LGGSGTKYKQFCNESSKEPYPLYGGISFLIKEFKI